MSELLAELAAELRELEAHGLERTLEEPFGLDFCSNDYLGLAGDPALLERTLEHLAGRPIGTPASRLLRGHSRWHRELEERLARFKGTEAALFFPSGYQANLALLAALVGPDDVVISDALNHASLIDGLRLARCRKVVIPHLDSDALERALSTRDSSGRAYLLTESLFSMDGDIAPLDRYAEIADRFGALLLVDDAHGTGVFGGTRGSGLTERFGIERRATAIMSTCGKALGVSGAFIGGPRVLIDFLVNRARPFIFSTAPAPLLLAGVSAALDLIDRQPERRARVLALAERLRVRTAEAGLDRPMGDGQIVPVILGENERARLVAGRLRAAGFDVRAVRPPTVAPGTARLRISTHANHSESMIDSLALTLADAVRTA